MNLTSLLGRKARTIAGATVVASAFMTGCASQQDFSRAVGAMGKQSDALKAQATLTQLKFETFQAKIDMLEGRIDSQGKLLGALTPVINKLAEMQGKTMEEVLANTQYRQQLQENASQLVARMEAIDREYDAKKAAEPTEPAQP